MSALDLFAMLNAPLPGGGAGVSASDQGGEGGGGDVAQGAFAGLLAMLAPRRDDTPTPATAVRDEADQGRFRSTAPLPFPGLSEEPLEDGDGESRTEAGEADEIALAPAAPTAMRTPAVVTPSASAREKSSAAREPSSGVSPAASSEPDSAPTHGEPSADAGDEIRFGTPAAAAAATVPATATAAQPVQAAQAAPRPYPQPQPIPAPAPAAIETAAAAAAKEAVEPAGAAVEPLPAKTAQGDVQTAAAMAAPPASEPDRLAQPPRPEPAPADRRAERRDGEGRATLFATAETGEPSRPAIAASPQADAPAAPAPRSGTAPLQARAEPPPVPINGAAREGEAAPEPARAVGSQGAAASLRDHLPSALTRAGVETTAMLSAQIVRRLEARATRFEMVLTPEDLGRVDVRMEVDSDGQLTARLAFDNPAAAADLRGRADELRRQLEAAGFQMSEGSLEFAERDGGRRDNPLDRRERAFSGAGRLAETADAVPRPSRWMSLSLTPEGVDMKV